MIDLSHEFPLNTELPLNHCDLHPGGIHAAYARDLWHGVTIIYCSSIVLAKISSGVDFAWFPPGDLQSMVM